MTSKHLAFLFVARSTGAFLPLLQYLLLLSWPLLFKQSPRSTPLMKGCRMSEEAEIERKFIESQLSDHYEDAFPRKVLTGLGICHVVTSLILLIIEMVVNIAFDAPGHLSIGFLGFLIFALAGAIGLITTYRPAKCIIIVYLIYMVLSIIVTLIMILIFITEMNGKNMTTIKTQLIIMLCVNLVEIVALVASSVFGCLAVCCGNRHFEGTVIVISSSNQNNPNSLQQQQQQQQGAPNNSYEIEFQSPAPHGGEFGGHHPLLEKYHNDPHGWMPRN